MVITDSTVSLAATFDPLFAEYNVRIENFTSFLDNRTQSGFNPVQFEVFRDNYFYRTRTTVEGVARAALSAAVNNDRFALCCLAQNLNDESGRGAVTMNHQQLMEEAFNFHGRLVFGVDPISVQQAESSSRVLSQSREYRRVHRRLLSSDNHVEVLAASYAQEQAANGMLSLFQKTFFVPYRGYYQESQFAPTMRYFSEHLDGVEEKHGEMAWLSLMPHLDTTSKRSLAMKAVETFLTAQANLWDALQFELEQSLDAGESIPPK